MKLTNDQLDTLRHILGINTPYDRVPRSYRNCAAVNPGDLEFIELEKIGAVERYQIAIETQYHWYQCTEAGKLVAMRSHKAIQKTKAQRRYSAYLDMTDICQDLTFREFLIAPEYAEIRENA